MSLRPRGAPLGVCIMTADFWGLKTAGGTATAYHLLAQVPLLLAKHNPFTRHEQVDNIDSFTTGGTLET